MRETSDGRRCSRWGSRRAAVLVSLLASLLLPLAPAGAASPVALARTNVLTATRPSAVTVRVPRAASLVIDDSTASSPNVEIKASSGRIAGFVLTPLRRSDPNVSSTILLLQVGACSTAACKPAPYEYVSGGLGLPTQRLSPSTRKVTLPAGDYALRAITDGAPVRVTMRLDGLSGSRTLPVTRPHAVTLRTDSAPSSATGVDPLRNVGVTHRFHSDVGLMFHVILAAYEPHVRSYAGVCLYLDAKPPTGRYHPGCPSAASENRYEAGYPALRYERVIYGADIALRAGEWTVGSYLTGAGAKSSLTVVTLWTDLA